MEHKFIDTASDLRDLIAQTPEETEALEAPHPIPTSSIRVELPKDDFAELRVTLIKLRDEIEYSLGSKPNAKKELVEMADKILEKAHWMNVKFIY